MSAQCRRRIPTAAAGVRRPTPHPNRRRQNDFTGGGAAHALTETHQNKFGNVICQTRPALDDEGNFTGTVIYKTDPTPDRQPRGSSNTTITRMLSVMPISSGQTNERLRRPVPGRGFAVLRCDDLPHRRPLVTAARCTCSPTTDRDNKIIALWMAPKPTMIPFDPYASTVCLIPSDRYFYCTMVMRL